MFPCIFLKKIGNLDMTLVKDSLTINLFCEQVTHEYSLGKRILWFFNEYSCDYSIIWHITEDIKWPNLLCQMIKIFGLLNF